MTTIYETTETGGPPTLIVFTGPKGSGKDTAAKRLFVRGPEYAHINFAHPLKKGLSAMFGFTEAELNDADLKEQQLARPPYLIPRDVMVSIAKWGIAEYGTDIWAFLWVSQVMNCDKPYVVCTDLRRPPELSRLGEFAGGRYDTHLVYVHNPRVEALRTKGIAEGDPRWTDDSEAHYEILRDVADHELDNSGSLDHLFNQVDKLFPISSN